MDSQLLTVCALTPASALRAFIDKICPERRANKRKNLLKVARSLTLTSCLTSRSK